MNMAWSTLSCWKAGQYSNTPLHDGKGEAVLPASLALPLLSLHLIHVCNTVCGVCSYHLLHHLINISNCRLRIFNGMVCSKAAAFPAL